MVPAHSGDPDFAVTDPMDEEWEYHSINDYIIKRRMLCHELYLIVFCNLILCLTISLHKMLTLR